MTKKQMAEELKKISKVYSNASELHEENAHESLREENYKQYQYYKGMSEGYYEADTILNELIKKLEG